MKCYIYEHCPFSLRVRVMIGLKKLPVEIVVLPFSDRQTPEKMVGKKICPILQKEDGAYMLESLDIAFYLDSLSGPLCITEKKVDKKFDNVKSKLFKSFVALTSPRFIALKMNEFKTEVDINLYREREESFLEDSFETIKNKEHALIEQAEAVLPEFESFLVSDSRKPTLTATELCMFSYLRNLSCVPGLTLPVKLNEFMVNLSQRATIKLLRQI